MDFRMDAAFESWGGFSESPEGSPVFHGKISYTPEAGVKLELPENPWGGDLSWGSGMPAVDLMFGQLVDGTLVTLAGCIITNAAVQIGFGIGSPTTVVANRAVFGRHVTDVDQLVVKKYSVELSSLSNWICSPPIESNPAFSDSKPVGHDVICRPPACIEVPLPSKGFDIRVAHRIRTKNDGCQVALILSAAITIQAHDSLSYRAANEIAWQCQNLMSLLVGDQLSVRALSVVPSEATSESGPQHPLNCVYQSAGKYDCQDVRSDLMLLPYAMVKDGFSAMVAHWFDRSEQAELATNILFGAQRSPSPSVNDKFLAAAQAAESYHRSLSTGFYMDQADFDNAVQELLTHIPECIQGDHRTSLKRRLKYGNEFSLRKRLAELFDRIPGDVGTRIAGDCSKFINRAVDTRNYYTHYDHAAKEDALTDMDAYVMAERLRVLVVANLLHDLGVADDKLLSVLERDQKLRHWIDQDLPL